MKIADYIEIIDAFEAMKYNTCYSRRLSAL